MKRQGSDLRGKLCCNDVLDIQINAPDQPRLLPLDWQGLCQSYGELQHLAELTPTLTVYPQLADNELMDPSMRPLPLNTCTTTHFSSYRTYYFY